MPITTNEVLSLEKHVFPILKKYEWEDPRWYDARYKEEAIITNDGYISICNSNHLFVRGSRKLAEFLQTHVQPFGHELTIQFYPEDVLPGPRPTVGRRILNYLKGN